MEIAELVDGAGMRSAPSCGESLSAAFDFVPRHTYPEPPSDARDADAAGRCDEQRAAASTALVPREPVGDSPLSPAEQPRSNAPSEHEPPSVCPTHQQHTPKAAASERAGAEGAAGSEQPWRRAGGEQRVLLQPPASRGPLRGPAVLRGGAVSSGRLGNGRVPVVPSALPGQATRPALGRAQGCPRQGWPLQGWPRRRSVESMPQPIE
jgi:hypothetical protein